MLVIHPDDKHTSLAKAIYTDLDARIVAPEDYERGIGQMLLQTPTDELVLMIGYGDSHGLYLHRCSEEIRITPSMLDLPTGFQGIDACMKRYAVSTLHAHILRRHNGNIIGIWPGAAEFARRYSLHGLFTDSFVYSRIDAERFGTITLDMHIDEANLTLYRTLGKLISQHVPLCKIPDMLAENICEKPNIISVNYESFTWM